MDSKKCSIMDSKRKIKGQLLYNLLVNSPYRDYIIGMDQKIKIDGVTYWHPRLSNISKKAKIGEGTVIHAGVHIHDEVIIGKRCQIQAGVMLFNGATLEDDVFMGPDSKIANDAKLEDRDVWTAVPTLVKRGAKIGMGALINAGLTIGEYSKVGMGAVVLQNIPDRETWVGVPARKVG